MLLKFDYFLRGREQSSVLIVLMACIEFYIKRMVIEIRRRDSPDPCRTSVLPDGRPLTDVVYPADMLDSQLKLT